MTCSTFTGNQALGGDGGGNAGGGAIQNIDASTLDVTGSTFTANQAIGGDGGVAAPAFSASSALPTGGAIRDVGDGSGRDRHRQYFHQQPGRRWQRQHWRQATSSRSSASARAGRSIRVSANLTVSDSTFIRNQALGGDNNSGGTTARGLVGTGGGGAIVGQPRGLRGRRLHCSPSTRPWAAPATLPGTSGTDSPNSIGGGGGGAILDIDGGHLTVTNSTALHNQAVGGAGSPGHDGGVGEGGGVGAASTARGSAAA